MLVLVFYLGEVMYIIKHQHIREVSPMVQLKRAAHMPSYFAGFFSYRGDVVPVLDLRLLIQGEACRMRLSTRILLVEYVAKMDGTRRVLGLIAERVTEAVRKPKESFAQAGVEFQNTPYLDEFMMEGEDMIQCINLDKLVNHLDFLNQGLLGMESPHMAQLARE